MDNPACYYIKNAEGKKIPVTHLDAIVTRLAGKISLHSFSDFLAFLGTIDIA